MSDDTSPDTTPPQRDGGGMSPEDGGEYASWSGIAQAIKAIAGRSVREGRTSTVDSAIMHARFDRFLSRVFADGDDSEWMLKGGIGMLARVPRARTTTDLDLAAGAADLDSAITALQDVAQRDLGDHLRFELIGTRATGKGDNQPGVQTRKVLFACFDTDTGRKVGEVPIDVVVGPPPVGRVDVIEPANRLQLSKPLASYPYRVYPVADHIADKVCATMTPAYAGGRPSSRVKDLVDLVIIARTQTVDLRELQLAITTKRALSKIPPFPEFAIPDGWADRYRALATQTPATADIPDADTAVELVSQLVGPALAEQPVHAGTRWAPDTGWTTTTPDHATAADSEPPDGGGEINSAASDVWVRPHSRRTGPVSGHYRSERGSSDPNQ